MRILIDAMGGDNAPQAPVMGALRAVKELGVSVHTHRTDGKNRAAAERRERRGHSRRA